MNIANITIGAIYFIMKNMNFFTLIVNVFWFVISS